MHAQRFNATRAAVMFAVAAAFTMVPSYALLAQPAFTDGSAKGRVSFTLERVGQPQSAFDPSWPVMVRWQYEAPDPSQSFTAELFGTANADGSMTLYGVVTSGYAEGRGVAVQVPSGSHGTASMSFAPALVGSVS